ncbi:MAG: helix-turn-helix transcriptional regulator [Acidimicrobiales bacterium]
MNTEDLLDAGEVAHLLGLSSRTAVSVYRSRYPDFPVPIVDKGYAKLWKRKDIQAWARETGRLK